LWNDSQAVILSTVFIIKFSATICATDSVAALTLIKPLQYPKLFSVIFGEGMINDAVAIILFKVVGKYKLNKVISLIIVQSKLIVHTKMITQSLLELSFKLSGNFYIL